MNDFLMIIFKTAVFLISYFIVSKYAFNYFKKRNPASEFWDVEIIAVSVVSAVIITSAAKFLIKLFI